MSEAGKLILGTITIIFLIVVFMACFREWIISKEKKGFCINGALAIGSLLSLIYTLGGL